ALIAIGYLAISGALLYVVWRDRSERFRRIYAFFATFIFAGGLSHLVEVWGYWNPNDWLSALLTGVAALLSIVTAAELVSMIPVGLAMRTPEELERLNQELAEARDCAIVSAGELELALAHTSTLIGARDAAVANAEQMAEARDVAV